MDSESIIRRAANVGCDEVRKERGGRTVYDWRGKYDGVGESYLPYLVTAGRGGWGRKVRVYEGKVRWGARGREFEDLDTQGWRL